jgi:hypothetical protein
VTLIIQPGETGSIRTQSGTIQGQLTPPDDKKEKTKGYKKSINYFADNILIIIFGLFFE